MLKMHTHNFHDNRHGATSSLTWSWLIQGMSCTSFERYRDCRATAGFSNRLTGHQFHLQAGCQNPNKTQTENYTACRHDDGRDQSHSGVLPQTRRSSWSNINWRSKARAPIEHRRGLRCGKLYSASCFSQILNVRKRASNPGLVLWYRTSKRSRPGY